MKGRAEENRDRSEGTEWEVPCRRGGRNPTGQKWGPSVMSRVFLQIGPMVTSQVQILMSMQLSPLLTTLVR